MRTALLSLAAAAALAVSAGSADARPPAHRGGGHAVYHGAYHRHGDWGHPGYYRSYNYPPYWHGYRGWGVRPFGPTWSLRAVCGE
ncbi:hypothetical protein [Frigoriglobus tundricola]|uniref:Sulfur globule protein n=1 Tax=Frigoriglobus tundricola TaxID=2774151 RepID=A0A6M5YR98_9BACT|nr:hypothetical protein [Frigoriglobus tundricola]QJW96597.1 hypothetical protein FTUN_4154 [Frigoriglobus tundricola]